MTQNPPPLISPVPGFEMRAVLDRDATLTAGLAVGEAGRRLLVIVGTPVSAPGAREEFLAWGGTLEEVSRVAPTSPIIAYGHTFDDRPYLATRVVPSLADRMRLIGPPKHRAIMVLASAVAEVLAATHAAGLVHGAVNPAAVLLDGEAAMLGGFGAMAPGLDVPLGVWAFTPPEHRAAATNGGVVGSPAADVFGLAATICVARAGMLPWSDPVGWAEAARLPVSRADWVEAIRAALDRNPDARPSAEEFASAMRTAPHEDVDAAARVDLRGLIPRQVRRLGAYSVDAMADAGTVSAGRAAPPGPGTPSGPAVGRGRVPWRPARGTAKPVSVPAGDGVGDDPAPPDSAEATTPGATAATSAGTANPTNSTTGTTTGTSDAAADVDMPIGLGQAMRTRPSVVGIAAIATAAILGTGAYAWAQHSPAPAAPAAAATVDTTPSTTPHAIPTPTLTTAELLAGARVAGQVFLRGAGAGDTTVCSNAIAGDIVTARKSPGPIDCRDFVHHVGYLLGAKSATAMTKATVVGAVSYANGSTANGAYPGAFISLPYVPDLRNDLTKLELVLTYRDGRWWVVQ
ncbi:MAG TPA: hypothetical protein VH442_18720, partial [Micromonosporaceae bacterium]